MRNHTATHLLHAALRERLGEHVRQAGSAVRPDKLRFDFTHGQALAAEELGAVEERVNEWIKASRPVRWLKMERPEAEPLGAMALFGEKYGEWVRVVEVDGVSRELCGGTHVANTAEVGIFKIVSEGSSAANVRRIEAITGPAAIDWFREREAQLREAGELLGNAPGPAGRRPPGGGAAARGRGRRGAGAGAGARRGSRRGWPTRRRAGSTAVQAVVRRSAEPPTPSSCSTSPTGSSRSSAAPRRWCWAAPRRKGRARRPGLEGRGCARASRPASRARGRAVVGGGGGGREDMAQAGGRDPAKLAEALAAAARRSSGSSAERCACSPSTTARCGRLRALGPERNPGDAPAHD